jgi:hypothetical protein
MPNWGESPCIEAPGLRLPKGYVQVYVPVAIRAPGHHKHDLAHRRALMAKLGRSLLPGMQACHHCDNPPCIQPEHLYEGTSADNHRDMVERGRGRGRYTGLIEPSIRAEIQRRYREGYGTGQGTWHRGGVSQRQLAIEYGLSQQTVSDIVREVRHP